MQSPDRTLSQRLTEAEEFFMNRGPVPSTLERLAQRLDEEGIPYAIVGGMALGLHGFERLTRDVDILLTPDGLVRFEERCVGRGYVLAFPGARKTFRDPLSGVAIEVLTTGEYPGDGKPKPVAFPDPAVAAILVGDIRVVALPKLIELKLASGLSAPHRLRDLADVQDLVVILNLPADLGEQLDASVRGEYRRLWEAAQGARSEPGPTEA